MNGENGLAKNNNGLAMLTNNHGAAVVNLNGGGLNVGVSHKDPTYYLNNHDISFNGHTNGGGGSGLENHRNSNNLSMFSREEALDRFNDNELSLYANGDMLSHLKNEDDENRFSVIVNKYGGELNSPQASIPYGSYNQQSPLNRQSRPGRRIFI